MIRHSLAVLLLAIAAAASTAAAHAETLAECPTIEMLFRPVFLGDAKLSPDGKYLAAITADQRDARNLRVANLETHRISEMRGGAGLDIYAFNWLGDDRIVFSVSQAHFYAYGLFVADPENLSSSHPINRRDAITVVGLSRSHPDRVLALINEHYENEGTGVVELQDQLVQIDASQSEVSAFNDEEQNGNAIVHSYKLPARGQVTGLVADYDGELGLCFMHEGGRNHLYKYEAATASWYPVPLALGRFRVKAMDPDGVHLWVTTHTKSQGYVLEQYDPYTEEFGDPVVSDPTYDLSVARLHFSRKSRRLVGVGYPQLRYHSVWLDPVYARIQAAVDGQFPNADNVLVNADDAENRFLFSSRSDRQPNQCVLFDLREKAIYPVFEAAPWLDGVGLARTRPIHFNTRDGVKLEGYLTVPPGASKDVPVPLVVLPHGGPWLRDTWGFDPEVQFLASRGYAVLQPNYRGSAGYAPQISHDRRFDFRRMNDDVTDATRAALRSGLIDPDRVAIMGGSFGGYLSLAGVAFEPGLYRCAVSLAGVFDYEEHMQEKKWNDQEYVYEYFAEHLGAPGTNKANFDAISPLRHVDQIRVPVLLAHGNDDGVVSVRQSKLMAEQLTKYGVPHETFYRSWEGHGFSRTQDRVDYYHLVDAFLARYLATPKTDAAAPTSALLPPS